MVSATDIETRPAVSRLARAVTEVFAPAVLAAVMPLIIAVDAASSWAAGLGWGLLAVLFSSAIPYGIIHLGVRRGTLTDHHIGVREQRRKPLIYGLLSVLAGLTALIVLDAPRPLTAMVLVMFAVLLTVTLISQVWKLSAHAAVSAGAASVLIAVFGPALAATFVVVALIGCSRVRLGDHTAGQVIAGAVAGTLIATPTFVLLA
ncbi:MAG TPA: phosphatase PAP2 family protein [Micromonospora sp.]|nr:phosphatase PAP2 family protein [Micromonospora sp.]